jgi:hypothetical protein
MEVKNILDMSFKEVKYIADCNGAIVFDLDELFDEGVLSLDDLGFLIEDE